MPTVVSESLQINTEVYNEYKETWAIPYYSGSELLALENYFLYDPTTRTLANTVEPFMETIIIDRMFDVIGEFTQNVISASYIVSRSNADPDILPPI